MPPLPTSETIRYRSATFAPGRNRPWWELSDGAELRRRRGSLFELVSGSAEVRSGPLATRLVIFHGPVFVEVHEGQDENTAGVTLNLRVDGEALTVEVVKGAVQLATPVATPKDLQQVKLAEGESATAKPGEKPTKAAAGD